MRMCDYGFNKIPEVGGKWYFLAFQCNLLLCLPTIIVNDILSKHWHQKDLISE